MIFWNFLVRYFQASFISFSLSAILKFGNTDLSTMAKTTSITILVIQSLIVTIIAYIVSFTKKRLLHSSILRNRFGNIYSKLDTRKRYKVLFGLMFFVQRGSLVLIVAFKYNFAIQWLLCQLVLMANIIYIFTASPYLDKNDGILDYINCCFVMFACVFTSTYSAWNTDPNSRFFYGLVFDSLVLLQFVVNLCYVAGQVFYAGKLKIQQLKFRYN